MMKIMIVLKLIQIGHFKIYNQNLNHLGDQQVMNQINLLEKILNRVYITKAFKMIYLPIIIIKILNRLAKKVQMLESNENLLKYYKVKILLILANIKNKKSKKNFKTT